MDKEMVSTFMEITACESEAYAVQHLGSCRWNLDEAINVYFNSGGGGGGPSVVSAPIPSEAEAAMEEENDNGGDDVRAPIPARVEALYELDDAYYYGDRIARAFDAPFGVDAPFALALSEIQAAGWGEEPEPGFGGLAAAEHVDSAAGKSTHDDDAAVEQEDHINNDSNNEDGGRMVISNNNDEDEEDNKDERSDDDDDMTYNNSDDDDEEIEDYGLEMDEDDDAYYASIADDAEEDQEPRPAAARPQQQQSSSLADMYKLPLDLMCDEPFHFAKVRAAREDRFLLVNLQARDFQSELYNRDLWSDEQVRGVVKGSLVLFLAQKTDTDRYGLGDECSMVCTFYKLDDGQLPAVLVLDPITGMMLEKWSGPMTPQEFVEFVGQYTTSKPSNMSKPNKFFKKAAAVVEQEPAAPAAEAGEQEPADKSAAPAAEAGIEAAAEEPVPEPEAEPPADEMVEEEEEEDEPMEGERLYKLRIRFPDGTMVAKEFGCKRKVASLFKFCKSTVHGGGEAAAEQKAFKIVRFAGGRFEAVKGDGGATFEDLDLDCATVSVVFDS